MTPLSVVADASPLIALERIDLLDRCASLFASCFIPPVVAREIAPSVRRRSWIDVRALTAPIDQRIVLAGLDPGEMEALGLAYELGGRRVLVDDLSARRMATSMRLPIIGTVGLLVFAKEQGVLPVIRPSIDELLATGFFVSNDVIEEALRRAGEFTTRSAASGARSQKAR